MEPLAPWAEPVLMTAEELFELPEDGWFYELVEGRLVRMSPTGGKHGIVTQALSLAIGNFVAERKLGRVLPADTGFCISEEDEPDTVLAPDLAFVRAERARDAAIPQYPRLAPDMVAEVVSPSQGRRAMRAKVRQWLDAGVRLVWLVFPDERVVEVWRPGAPVKTQTVADVLSGEDVLPGFAYPIAGLFEDVE